jgi:hypothetical protein
MRHWRWHHPARPWRQRSREQRPGRGQRSGGPCSAAAEEERGCNAQQATMASTAASWLQRAQRAHTPRRQAAVPHCSAQLPEDEPTPRFALQFSLFPTKQTACPNNQPHTPIRHAPSSTPTQPQCTSTPHPAPHMPCPYPIAHAPQIYTPHKPRPPISAPAPTPSCSRTAAPTPPPGPRR